MRDDDEMSSTDRTGAPRARLFPRPPRPASGRGGCARIPHSGTPTRVMADGCLQLTPGAPLDIPWHQECPPEVVGDLAHPELTNRIAGTVALRHDDIDLAQLRDDRFGLVSLPRHAGPPARFITSSGWTTSEGVDETGGSRPKTPSRAAPQCPTGTGRSPGREPPCTPHGGQKSLTKRSSPKVRS